MFAVLRVGRGCSRSRSPPHRRAPRRAPRRITGIITDQTGAAVPGATVTATNQATNVDYTAVSNEAGNYTITSVPVGTYVVKAELAGFKTATTKPITVEAKQIARLDFKLEVGATRTERRGHRRVARAADRVGDGRRGHLRHDAVVAAAERPQHRPALAAAARARHAEPEHVHRRSATSASAAGRTSTATASRPTTTRSTAST